MKIQAQPTTGPLAHLGGSGAGQATLETADLSDVEFRRRLHEREDGALAALFDSWFERVYGYVRRLVQDEAVAEDLTQDVFLHVHRALPSYDPQRELEPWLFTIAANKVRDHWRKRARRKTDLDRPVDAGLEEALPSEDPAPAHELEQSELTAAVQDAVQRLPESLAEAIRLRAFEGLSFEAMGERIQRNATAARKRYSRALSALRDIALPTWKTHVCEGCG